MQRRIIDLSQWPKGQYRDAFDLELDTWADKWEPGPDVDVGGKAAERKKQAPSKELFAGKAVKVEAIQLQRQRRNNTPKGRPNLSARIADAAKVLVESRSEIGRRIVSEPNGRGRLRRTVELDM